MKKYLSILLVIISILTLQQCDNPQKKESPVEKYKDNVVTYSHRAQQIKKVAPSCQPSSCTEVVINYPVFEPGQQLHQAINQLITETINTHLSDLILEADGSESTEELMQLFINSYESFKENFPESQAPWTVYIVIEVSYTNRSFISIKIESDSYTGGAHPLEQTNYLNISAEGERITDLSFYFNSVEKVSDLVNNKMRTMLNLEDDESFADRGFIFKDNQFQLTDNIVFSGAGAIFIWNSGDIAAYAEGPIILPIAFKDLRGLYKHKTL